RRKSSATFPAFAGPVIKVRPTRPMLLRALDGSRSRIRNEREKETGRVAPRSECLRGCGRLRPASTPGHCRAGHRAGAVVAEIGLLRAAAGVREVDPHYCAAPLGHFLRTFVTNEPGHTCQCISSFKSDLTASSLTESEEESRLQRATGVFATI